MPFAPDTFAHAARGSGDAKNGAVVSLRASTPVLRAPGAANDTIATVS